MHTFHRLLTIARPYAGRLLLVALLTSVGALAELVEPWVYRAIINDIAGMFVSRETGLLPEILEELRGGAGEAEPESDIPGPPGAAPARPATESASPATNAPTATVPSGAKPTQALRTHRRQRRIKAPPAPCAISVAAVYDRHSTVVRKTWPRALAAARNLCGQGSQLVTFRRGGLSRRHRLREFVS